MKNYHLLFVLLFLFSCKKEETTDDTSGPQSNLPDSIVAVNSSALVTGLNGFTFEAAFVNTEPLAYPNLWVQYIDDYLDSTRIVTCNQNTAQSITYYLCSSHANGVVTRSFDHVTFPNNKRNEMLCSFNHPQFLLQWYVPSTGELTTVGNVFGFNTSVSKIFTGMASQYTFEFLDRYLIRYISGISIWPFHHQNWTDQPQFVATQELSEPIAWDHWYDESWSTWPYDVNTNMYTGFVNSSNDTTYVGIAKGSLNLDTIHFRNATYTQFYATGAQMFLDKSGDTLFLGMTNKIPGSSNREISLYKYVIPAAQLVPLFEKMPLAGGLNVSRLRKGSFYFTPTNSTVQVMDRNGLLSTISGPSGSYGYGFMFGRNKLYFIAQNLNTPRVEVYSRGF